MENYKLQIIYPDAQNDQPHPHCPHGPTLLFQTPAQAVGNQIAAYYACAAHRDKRLCNYHLPVEQVTPQKLAKRYELDGIIDLYRQHRRKLLSVSKGGACHYCLRCNLPLLPDELSRHTGHEMVWNLSAELLRDPTLFLRPLDDDKVQAQYFFDIKALSFFATCFHNLGINKVVCMGAPRLHAYIRNECTEMRSFLLDFDHRMFYFYDDDNFAWYNMCNNHFFDQAQRKQFKKFLKCEPDEKLLIFTDPPFGCRTEPLAATLRRLTSLFCTLNHLPYQPLPIFWIFPYFSEHYIQQEMPHMRMCDYKVNYTNHVSFKDVGVGSRKLGSPVRAFTNVPLELLRLPVKEEYKYCALCQLYTALENRHCDKCACCPSKNGSTYRHCELCGCCVKSKYLHCKNCRRCTQSEEHECQMYQANQHCWICLQKGHTEFSCAEWSKHCRRKHIVDTCEKVITCLLCKRKGHNERSCAHRSKYLDEVTFMGVTEVTFK
ncbi:rRNA N6-adenosine-methyltransferase ZCCHC4 [Anastrepha ludens]|uniref:rRNA N6-adenosine-methyltransferase ZCCHC4 n=1 Tax=Anastrepha ludens TaxID=28586 RepID=UPI0023AFBFBC|nr:rRNA N6-adenosine-methyltransferase ZCCHC4 [Anastrepha ludens]